MMSVPLITLMRFMLLFICLTSCFHITTAKEYVPVYMWGSSSDSKSGHPIPALTKINSDEFKDLLAKKLQHISVVVVFVEENLSVEDFSWQDALGQGSYPKLQKLADSTQTITYLPNVHVPLHAIHGWTEKWVHTSLYPDGLKPAVTFTNETLLFVNLLDATGNEDRPHLLKKHDSFMSDIYGKLLEKHGSVVAIYTAQHSSWQSDEDISPPRRVRAKREITEGEVFQLYNGDNKTYLYTEMYPVLFVKDTSVSLENPSTVATVEDEEGTYQLVVTYLTVPETQVMFNFRQTSAGYWSMNDLVLTYDNENITMASKGIEAPIGFSYHCSQQVSFKSQDPLANLTFTNIQVQPNLIQGDAVVPRFGDAYDCVYFMTAPILSGFFVTIIFAFIMGFGICMIMDIKTMDRFDDPKGKTITINTSE